MSAIRTSAASISSFLPPRVPRTAHQMKNAARPSPMIVPTTCPACSGVIPQSLQAGRRLDARVRREVALGARALDRRRARLACCAIRDALQRRAVAEAGIEAADVARRARFASDRTALALHRREVARVVAGAVGARAARRPG